jgi:diacylglycerol kinase (ATP)
MNLPTKSFAVMNTHASRAAAGTEPLVSRLQALGVTVLPTSDGEAIAKIVERAISAGAELLIAAGGDGTVTAVANAILTAKSTVPMAIIPLGTGNDLARSLGVPLDPEAAVTLLTTAKRRAIDVVHVRSGADGSFMLNMATGGSSTQTTQATTKESKRRFKAWSYFLNSWRAITGRRAFKVRAWADGRRVKCKALNITVANGRSAGGGFVLAPHAELDDGLIDFVAVRRSSWWDLIRMAAKLLVGRLNNDPKLLEVRCRRLELTAKPAFALSVDGEVGLRTPIVFTVAPGALTVLVP